MTRLMNICNPRRRRGSGLAHNALAVAVALMLAAVACSQPVEETAQTAAAATTAPTAAGTTTPDVSTATTAEPARDDGGDAEVADTADASDEQATTGTAEPGAPDVTDDTTVGGDGEGDDVADDAPGDSEEDDGEADGESDSETDPAETDTDTENGDSEADDDEGEPDDGESEDTEGSEDDDGDEEEETSGNAYPSTAEEARAAGLMVVDSALVLSSLRLPSDAENYYPATDAFLDGSGAEWGLRLPKKKELWVPPSTGNTHHIDLEFLYIENEFFDCVPSMSNPVATLPCGRLGHDAISAAWSRSCVLRQPCCWSSSPRDS